jgi:hypothetical protein
MLREDRVRREDRLGAFGDRQGPCVGRLHNSRGAGFGSGAVLVDKKALPLIQLVTATAAHLVRATPHPVEFTKSISGARPHPNPRCRDAIREQIAAP